MGSDRDSPPSFIEAATAAAALAAEVVTLFLRVTRWLALTAPSEMECAWERWLGLRGRERDNSYRAGRQGHIISLRNHQNDSGTGDGSLTTYLERGHSERTFWQSTF